MQVTSNQHNMCSGEKVYGQLKLFVVQVVRDQSKYLATSHLCLWLKSIS